MKTKSKIKFLSLVKVSKVQKGGWEGSGSEEVPRKFEFNVFFNFVKFFYLESGTHSFLLFYLKYVSHVSSYNLQFKRYEFSQLGTNTLHSVFILSQPDLSQQNIVTTK